MSTSRQDPGTMLKHPVGLEMVAPVRSTSKRPDTKYSARSPRKKTCHLNKTPLERFFHCSDTIDARRNPVYPTVRNMHRFGSSGRRYWRGL